MGQKMYQVDAFADNVFSGNPAAVCPLSEWLSDVQMINIAAENNLAETAFYVERNGRFEIRWFTPTVEVDLCGHATLAAAYVLFHHENFSGTSIEFYSPRSGALRVSRNAEMLTLDFPADPVEPVYLNQDFQTCLNRPPIEVFRGKTDLMFVYASQAEIEEMQPNLLEIEKLSARGVIITAPGVDADFVSRFFAPQSGVNEDPVTGSAHTTLTPFWAKRLGKVEMTAIQLSQRQGRLNCKVAGDRVEISGKGRLYLIGEIFIN